jgi:hypothetical protein
MGLVAGATPLRRGLTSHVLGIFRVLDGYRIEIIERSA